MVCGPKLLYLEKKIGWIIFEQNWKKLYNIYLFLNSRVIMIFFEEKQICINNFSVFF